MADRQRLAQALDNWQSRYNATFNRNRQWAQSLPSYTTQLSPPEEQAFRSWVTQNRVPFNPVEPTQDYDMRGYWKSVAAQGGNQTAINPNDHQLHFPDTFKTPYHQSFSNESMYALPTAPRWVNDYQLVDPATGTVVFDERRR